MAEPYTVPQYQPAPGAAWLHVLYGHVPRHQQDFILRPATPFENFRPQHYGDLQPLIRGLQPPAGRDLAFLIGNLSAGDTRHRAGHGGLALVVATRVQGALDHAGRDLPTFAHAAFFVDQPVDATFLQQAAESLVRRFQQAGPRWYRGYYEGGAGAGGAAQAEYLRGFDEPTPLLPAPPTDGVTTRWKLREGRPRYNRVLIVRPPEAPFAAVAAVMARLGALLYCAKLRWVSISDSHEEARQRIYDINPTELSVRFVSHAPTSADPRVFCCGLDEVPLEDWALADLLGLLEQRATQVGPAAAVLSTLPPVPLAAPEVLSAPLQVDVEAPVSPSVAPVSPGAAPVSPGVAREASRPVRVPDEADAALDAALDRTVTVAPEPSATMAVPQVPAPPIQPPVPAPVTPVTPAPDDGTEQTLVVSEAPPRPTAGDDRTQMLGGAELGERLSTELPQRSALPTEIVPRAPRDDEATRLNVAVPPAGARVEPVVQRPPPLVVPPSLDEPAPSLDEPAPPPQLRRAGAPWFLWAAALVLLVAMGYVGYGLWFSLPQVATAPPDLARVALALGDSLPPTVTRPPTVTPLPDAPIAARVDRRPPPAIPVGPAPVTTLDRPPPTKVLRPPPSRPVYKAPDERHAVWSQMDRANRCLRSLGESLQGVDEPGLCKQVKQIHDLYLTSARRGEYPATEMRDQVEDLLAKVGCQGIKPEPIREQPALPGFRPCRKLAAHAQSDPGSQ